MPKHVSTLATKVGMCCGIDGTQQQPPSKATTLFFSARDNASVRLQSERIATSLVLVVSQLHCM